MTHPILLLLCLALISAQQVFAATSSIIGTTFNIESKPNNDSIISLLSNDASIQDKFEVNTMVYHIGASAFNRQENVMYLAMGSYELLTVQVLPEISIREHVEIPVVPQLMHYSPKLKKIVALTMHNVNKISLIDVNTTVFTDVLTFNDSWGVYMGPTAYDYVLDRLYFTVSDSKQNFIVQVDVKAGKITKMIPLDDAHGAIPDTLEFHVETGHILGTFQGRLVLFHVDSGKVDPIARLPTGIPASLSSAYDEQNAMFYYSAIKFEDTLLVAVNVNTGEVTYKNIYNSYKNTHWYMRG